RDPQPGRGGLPRRRDPGDGGAARPHRRAHRGRPAAAAHPRHARLPRARRVAQPHLAPDRGAAAVSAALARRPRRIAVPPVLPALVFGPVLSGVIALPLIVLYPVLVAWLGIGVPSKIAYGAAAGFFPVALAAVLGMRGIDPRYAEMARAVGATPLQIVTQVKM